MLIRLSDSDAASWKKALNRAALPNAKCVVFMKIDSVSDNTISFELKSLDATSKAVGDDRDYHLLKSVMGPLEALADNIKEPSFIVEYDLVRNIISVNTA